MRPYQHWQYSSLGLKEANNILLVVYCQAKEKNKAKVKTRVILKKDLEVDHLFLKESSNVDNLLYKDNDYWKDKIDQFL